MNPKISVIIPVFNTGKSAKALIEFLLGLPDNLEIICIDDGSRDDSWEVLGLIPKNAKLKLYRQANGGASAARNAGLEKATGDFIAFIDSDDMVSWDFFRLLLAEMGKPSVALVVAGLEYHRVKTGASFFKFTKPAKSRASNESLPAYVLKLLLADGRMYAVINKLFRAEVIKKHNIRFDEKMDFAEDTDFVLQYLNHARGEIKFVPKPLYKYFYGTETSLVGASSLQWKNWQKSFRKLKEWVRGFFGDLKIPRRERKLLRLIYWRWRMSHALAVARSDKSFGKKISLVNLPLLLLAKIATYLRS